MNWLLLCFTTVLVNSASATVFNQTIYLNDTGTTTLNFVAGDSGRIKLVIPSSSYAVLLFNGSNIYDGDDINVTNSVNDVIGISYSTTLNIPPSFGYIDVALRNNFTTNTNDSAHMTASITLAKVPSPTTKNSLLYTTKSGGQAIVFTPQCCSQNIFIFNSSNGVAFNVLSEYTAFDIWENYFVFDGPITNGNVVATLYSLQDGLALKSKSTSFTLLKTVYDPNVITILANDVSNLNGIAKAVAVSAEMATFVYPVIDATQGPATVTLVSSNDPMYYNYEFNYILDSITFLLSSNQSKLQVYAGSPLPNPLQQNVYLSSYTPTDMATRLPQYFNFPVVTFQLNFGNCYLDLYRDTSAWSQINGTRQGFIATNLYPFNNVKQHVNTTLQSNHNTKFAFSLGHTINGGILDVSLVPDNGVVQNYTLKAGLKNSTVTIVSKRVQVMATSQSSSTGALLVFEASVESAVISTKTIGLLALLSILVHIA